MRNFKELEKEVEEVEELEKEVRALANVGHAMKSLEGDRDAVKRVLDWAGARYLQTSGKFRSEAVEKDGGGDEAAFCSLV